VYSVIGSGPHNSSDENKAVAKDDAAEIEWMNIEALVDKNLASIINIFYWITRDGKNLAEYFGRLKDRYLILILTSIQHSCHLVTW
jgi:hypothetical protein